MQHGGDLSPGSTKAALGISATAFEIGHDNNGVGKPHCSAFFIVLITVQKEEKQEIAQISSLRFHLASRVPQQIKLKWAPSWLLRYHAELPWAPSPPALLKVIMLSECSKQAAWGQTHVLLNCTSVLLRMDSALKCVYSVSSWRLRQVAGAC